MTQLPTPLSDAISSQSPSSCYDLHCPFQSGHGLPKCATDNWCFIIYKRCSMFSQSSFTHNSFSDRIRVILYRFKAQVFGHHCYFFTPCRHFLVQKFDDSGTLVSSSDKTRNCILNIPWQENGKEELWPKSTRVSGSQEGKGGIPGVQHIDKLSLDTSHKCNHTVCVLLRIRLLLHGLAFSSVIHIVACYRYFIPFCWHIIHHILFMHSLNAENLSCFHFPLLWIMMYICIIFLCRHMLSFLLALYLVVVLLSHITLCWTVWVTSRLFDNPNNHEECRNSLLFFLLIRLWLWVLGKKVRVEVPFSLPHICKKVIPMRHHWVTRDIGHHHKVKVMFV